jgi:hypothetical protein
MHCPNTDINHMIEQLNQFQIPSSLMESFDAYREEAMKAVSKRFSRAQLDWFLDLLNRFRGPDDYKDSLLDVFDPGMFTCDHPAWDTAPGTRIEMPALTSEVARLALENSEFAQVAQEEILEFRRQANTYTDEQVVGLAKIASAALVDRRAAIRVREDAICYLAMNASAELEDLWASDDTLWRMAPARVIDFNDMVAKRKAELSQTATPRPAFLEADFACFSEEEIRAFAFDVRTLFLAERAKHLAICSRCQKRLEYWSGLVENFDWLTVSFDRRPDA